MQRLISSHLGHKKKAISKYIVWNFVLHLNSLTVMLLISMSMFLLIYMYASECVETLLVLAWESCANTLVETESRYPTVPAVSHPSFRVGQLFSFCGRSTAWKYLSTLK